MVVLLPLLLWLIVGWLRGRIFETEAARADWIDGVLTAGLDAGPAWSGVSADPDAAAATSSAQDPDLFVDRPVERLAGCDPGNSAVVWFVRRLLGRMFPKSAVWGVERPALETWTAILAFAPVVGWLGNPAWWRETLPRLAHYYTLNVGRRGALPDISDHLFRPGLRVQPSVA